MHVVDNSDAVRVLGSIRSVGQSGQIHTLPLYCSGLLDVSRSHQIMDRMFTLTMYFLDWYAASESYAKVLSGISLDSE
jgi:hypothetical protein